MRSHLHETYKENIRKYKELQQRRIDEIVGVEEKLQGLRSAVSNYELRLTSVSAQNVPSEDDFNTLKNLKQRLRVLQKESAKENEHI
jgi:predicted  nucleic acid-binding Zn-ribbon protein